MDGSYQGEEDPCSIFTIFTPRDKFSHPLAFRLMGQFFMLISLLQKRIRLDFDESDEDEMAKLMAEVPACSTVGSG